MLLIIGVLVIVSCGDTNKQASHSLLPPMKSLRDLEPVYHIGTVLPQKDCSHSDGCCAVLFGFVQDIGPDGGFLPPDDDETLSDMALDPVAESFMVDTVVLGEFDLHNTIEFHCIDARKGIIHSPEKSEEIATGFNIQGPFFLECDEGHVVELHRDSGAVYRHEQKAQCVPRASEVQESDSSKVTGFCADTEGLELQGRTLGLLSFLFAANDLEERLTKIANGDT